MCVAMDYCPGASAVFAMTCGRGLTAHCDRVPITVQAMVHARKMAPAIATATGLATTAQRPGARMSVMTTVSAWVVKGVCAILATKVWIAGSQHVQATARAEVCACTRPASSTRRECLKTTLRGVMRLLSTILFRVVCAFMDGEAATAQRCHVRSTVLFLRVSATMAHVCVTSSKAITDAIAPSVLVLLS